MPCRHARELRGRIVKIHDQAALVAREQVAWFRAGGHKAADVLRALGHRRVAPAAGWDDVFTALAAAWLELQRDALREARRRLAADERRIEARP